MTARIHPSAHVTWADVVEALTGSREDVRPEVALVAVKILLDDARDTREARARYVAALRREPPRPFSVRYGVIDDR